MSECIVKAMSDLHSNVSFGGGGGGGGGGGARFDADGNGRFNSRDVAIHGVCAAAAAGGGLVGMGAGTVVGGPVGGFVGGAGLSAAVGAACYDAYSR
mgnify:CR=1 FL=1